MIPEMDLLSYPLLGLLLLILLGAALLAAALSYRQHAPARNKIPRAQRRREVALQQMAALAQRLRQQVSGHQSMKPPASIPTGGSYLRTYPSHCLITFKRQGAPSQLSMLDLSVVSSSPFLSFDPFSQGQCVFSVLPVPGTWLSNMVYSLGLFVEIK